MSVYDVLKERGFLKQLSHEDEIKELLEKEKSLLYWFRPHSRQPACRSFYCFDGYEPYAACRTSSNLSFRRRDRYGWRPQRQRRYA